MRRGRAGAVVPEFTRVLVHEELREWMERVPSPWVLKPRAEASAIGIQEDPRGEPALANAGELGDRQSYYLLEQFVPGDIFHVDSIVSEGEVVFASVSGYGKPPMQAMHEGGVFTTRVLERGSGATRSLMEINGRLMPEMGMVRGVTHAEYMVARTRQGWAVLLSGGGGAGGGCVYRRCGGGGDGRESVAGVGAD